MKKGKLLGSCLDTKGPEIRTHSMEDGKLELVTGQRIDISMTQVEGNNDVFSVSYDKLIEDVDEGSVILLRRWS